MIFRAVRESDIPDIMDLRASVKENQLSDSTNISDQEYKKHLFESGKGWLCLINDKVVGFGGVDFEDCALWAFEVHPGHLEKGIGSHLHDLLINWYFASGAEPIWANIAPKSKTEQLCLSKGWIKTGVQNGAVRMELASNLWNKDHKDVSSEGE